MQQEQHTPLNNIHIYMQVRVRTHTHTHSNARHTNLPSNELGYIEHIFSLFLKRSPLLPGLHALPPPHM